MRAYAERKPRKHSAVCCNGGDDPASWGDLIAADCSHDNNTLVTWFLWLFRGRQHACGSCYSKLDMTSDLFATWQNYMNKTLHCCPVIIGTLQLCIMPNSVKHVHLDIWILSPFALMFHISQLINRQAACWYALSHPHQEPPSGGVH